MDKTQEFFSLRREVICIALRNQLVSDAVQASNASVLFTDETFLAGLDTLDPDCPGFDSVDVEQAIRAFVIAHDLIV